MSAIEQAAQPAKAGRIGVWPVPVTALCCAIAIAITVAIHAGVDVSALYEGPEIGQGQLWRLVTSAFVHIPVPAHPVQPCIGCGISAC